MGGRWPCSCRFVQCCFLDLFKTAHSIIMLFLSSPFSLCFVHACLVLPYCSTNSTTSWKKPCFVSSDRSDFHVIDNLSIAFKAFARNMLISLSVNEMLLPRYVNWSTNFRGLLLRVEMAPCCLKHMNSGLFAFTQRPIPLSATQ